MNGTEVAAAHYQHHELVIAFQSLALFIVISATILGNFVVILAVRKDLRMQTVGNIFVFNVSVADLAMSCQMAVSLVSLLNGTWPFYRCACVTDILCSSTFTRVNLLTQVIITYKKYREICKDVHSNLLRSHVYCIIGIIWLVSISMSVPYPSRRAVYQSAVYHCTYNISTDSEIIRAIEYTILAVEIALFLLIATFIWRIHKTVLDSKNLVAPNIVSNEREMRAYSKVYSCYATKVGLGIYLVLILPHFTSSTVLKFQIVGSISPGWQFVFYWFFCCHCAFKPMIYAKRSNRFVQYLGWHVSRLLGYQKYLFLIRKKRMEMYWVPENNYHKNSHSQLQVTVCPPRGQLRTKNVSSEFSDLAVLPYYFQEEKRDQCLNSPSEPEISFCNLNSVTFVQPIYSDQLKKENLGQPFLVPRDADFSLANKDLSMKKMELSSTLEKFSEARLSSYQPPAGTCEELQKSEDKQQFVYLCEKSATRAVQAEIHPQPKTRKREIKASSSPQLNKESDCLDEEFEIELKVIPDGCKIIEVIDEEKSQSETRYKTKKRLQVIPLKTMLPGVPLEDEMETTI